jgi:EmrB/QacA subfamily drug resistance transporter
LSQARVGPTAAPGPADRAGVPKGALLIFVGVQLGQVMSTLDGTIVATALPTITDDLGGFSRVTWVITAYVLGVVATMPLYGKIGDLYGRKKVLVAAISLFLVASVACGLAQTMDQLLVARFVQGLGGGGLATLAMAVIADVVPARQLGRWLGYQGVIFAISSVAGPVVGGLFVDHLSWRWAFLINLPIGMVAMTIVVTRLRIPYRRIPHALDLLGSALLATALACLVLVATLGGRELPWDSARLIGLVVAIVVLVALFIRRERVAPEPVLPLSLLRDPVMRVCVGVNFTSGLLLWCGIFFVPLFVQEVRGVTPTRAGFVLMPLMFGAAFGTLVAGRMVARSGRYRSWPLTGSVLMLAGVALLATLGPTTPIGLIGAYALVLGTGVGFVMQPSLLAAQNSAAQRDLGTATSTALLFRSLGNTIGIPIFGGILNAGLAGGPRTPAAFADALPNVFLAAVPVAVVSVVIAWRLQDRPLREEVPLLGAVAPGAADG